MAYVSESDASSLTHWTLSAVFGLTIAIAAGVSPTQGAEQIGQDNNNIDNPLVQPQDPELDGNGADQSLQNGDILIGTRRADVQIGLLGIDVMLGQGGNDVQIGGPDPGGNNNDRAFGGPGADVFLWQGGDGSDFFDGGPQADAVVFGDFVTESEEETFPLLDPETGLPAIDVTNNGGFCEVVDGYESAEDAAALEELGLDHLVRFLIRAQADNGIEDGDNGLRVTLHLVNVEYAVCASREGGTIEVFDLRSSPPEIIDIDDITNNKLRNRLQQIVL